MQTNRKNTQTLDPLPDSRATGSPNCMGGAQTPVPLSRPAPIFAAFLRLGATAFGGPAMIAYIRDMSVRRKRWLTEESFNHGAALCQFIPGATAMQMAAYVGLRAGGPAGALAAFVGFGFPAFCFMVVLSAAYHASCGIPFVASAFLGLHVIVVALMANAAFTFLCSSICTWRDAILFFAAAIFLISGGSPILAIAASAIVAPILYMGAELPSSSAPLHQGSKDVCTMRPVLMAIAAAVAAFVALFLTSRSLFGLGALMVRVDLFAFGGGFASIPVLFHEVVDVRKWMDSKTFMDGIALGQITPGPIVITATFVGYQAAGLPGAIVGTIAVFLPSFLMVLITVPYLDTMQRSLWFRRMLRGILASFVGLLAAVTVQFSLTASWSVAAVLLALAAFTALRFKVDVLWVVLAGAALSPFV